jgi:hypothetical protein
MGYLIIQVHRSTLSFDSLCLRHSKEGAKDDSNCH